MVEGAGAVIDARGRVSGRSIGAVLAAFVIGGGVGLVAALLALNRQERGAPETENARESGGRSKGGTQEAPESAPFFVDESRDPTARASHKQTTIQSEQAEFNLKLMLPHAPEGWLREPFPLAVRFTITRSTEPALEMSLEVKGPESYGGQNLNLSSQWDSAGGWFLRKPWRGGDEVRELQPGDLKGLRTAVEVQFERLLVRTR